MKRRRHLPVARVVVGARLTEAEAFELERIADTRQISISKAVRECVRAAIELERQTEEKRAGRPEVSA